MREQLARLERLASSNDVAELRREAGEAAALSIGLAALAPAEDAASWLRRADAALYAAKSAGRDRVALAPAPAEAG